MKKKVLLMGKSGSGKTSMRSIIFSNYIARDTRRLGATIDVESSSVKFLGNLTLNLWDCGGQEAFMENYFASQRSHIFNSVELLIYVFDVESRDSEKDIHYYQWCLEAILEKSPNAKIFCLLHKMDLIPLDQRDQLFSHWKNELQRLSLPLETVVFPTSIWDETLYAAWSKIVHCLIPNIETLQMHLDNFCEICDADEVVLFERTTILVIANAARVEHADIHRFEKISSIIKQFNPSGREPSHFKSMEIRSGSFSAFIDVLTNNTYVMVVLSDSSIQSAATLHNITVARKHFKLLEIDRA
ncbi:GTP-binding protein gtr1 [Umbelopsis sp. WA50703]